MKRVLFVVGALFWAFLVFLVTFFVTFPSQVLADRIRYEIPNVLGRDYSGEVASVRPWWVGLSANDIKLYKDSGPVRSTDDGEPAEGGRQLVALLGNVSLRVSPWSLLRRTPYVRGSVTLTEGRVDYSIGTTVDKRGEKIQLSDLVLGAEGMPLADLFVLMPNLTATGNGTVDLDVDLHAGENGMRDATGRIAFGGTNLSLADIELPMLGALGMEVPISELALAADVVDGVATISSGKLTSDIANVELSGTITLRDPIDRSAVDVQISLSNLGEALTPYAGFMSEAKQADGTYQYSCRGVLSRLSANSCSVGSHERRVSSRPLPGGTTSSTPITTRSSPSSARDAESDDERERRRDEIRERLRQKREERDAERGTTRPTTAEEPIDGDEEPEIEDEHPEEEDLPADEGEPEQDEPLE